MEKSLLATLDRLTLETDLPLPAFLGGRGGASAVGEVGESVLVEAKI